MPLLDHRGSTPVVGSPLTWRRQEAWVPATILGISRSGFRLWFECDADRGQAPRVIYRARLFPDGRYREEQECWPVEVGVREQGPRAAPSARPYREQPLSELAYSVERIEPRLRQTRWYPMTYMLIPSILSAADELLSALRAYPGIAESERVEAQRLEAHLAALRRDFHRAR